MAIATVSTGTNFHKTLNYVQKPDSELVYSQNVAISSAASAQVVAKQMARSAALSARVRKPVYHLSLSPAQSDELSAQDWNHLARALLHDIGMDEHQAVGYLHRDETYPDGSPRPHLHLVINRVDLSGRAWDTSWDYVRIQQAVRHLEQSYGLKPMLNSWEQPLRHDPPGQHYRAERDGIPSVRSQLQRAIDAAVETSNTLEDFRAHLDEQGINTLFTPQGWAFQKEGLYFAGHQLGRAYTRSAILEELAMPDVVRPTRMGDLMRQASHAQTEREAQQRARDIMRQAGAALNSVGQQMAADADFDGMTLIGNGVRLGGAAITLGAAFAERLTHQRQRVQSQRVAGILDALENVGDRTTRIEGYLARSDRVPASSLFTSSATSAAADPSAEYSEAYRQPPEASDDSFADLFGLANERINRLERQMGIEPDPSSDSSSFGDRPTVDPTAPIDQQLGQIELVLEEFNQRLERIETALGIDPNLQPAAILSGEATAETLTQYVQARAEVYGLNPAEPVPTRSMGTVESDAEGRYIRVEDESYGVKFEAAQIGNEESPRDWEVLIDDLSVEEKQRIAGLPQTPEAYQQQANGKSLVSFFQKNAPQQFEGREGAIRWKDRQGEFDYSFKITADGFAQTVTGVETQTQTPVFQARISARDGVIQTQFSRIPTERINDLLNEQQSEPTVDEQKTQSVRSSQRGRRRREKQLSL